MKERERETFMSTTNKNNFNNINDNKILSLSLSCLFSNCFCFFLCVSLIIDERKNKK